MVRDGFLLPKDGATSTAQPKWVDGDDIDLSEDEDNHKSSYVASHAWGVVDWWIKLFETDQAINSAELGSGACVCALHVELLFHSIQLPPRNFCSHTCHLHRERVRPRTIFKPHSVLHSLR
jgi:hypothetical protein